MHTPKQLVRSARRITVLTGAGISAESGIPTFRGAGGLWRDFRRRRSRHSRSILARSATRLGVVRLASPNHREGRAQRRPPSPRETRRPTPPSSRRTSMASTSGRAARTSSGSTAASGMCVVCGVASRPRISAFRCRSFRHYVRAAVRCGRVSCGSAKVCLRPSGIMRRRRPGTPICSWWWGHPQSSIRPHRWCLWRAARERRSSKSTRTKRRCLRCSRFSLRGAGRRDIARTDRMRICYIDAFSGISGDMTVGRTARRRRGFRRTERGADLARHRRDVSRWRRRSGGASRRPSFTSKAAKPKRTAICTTSTR